MKIMIMGMNIMTTETMIILITTIQTPLEQAPLEQVPLQPAPPLEPTPLEPAPLQPAPQLRQLTSKEDSIASNTDTYTTGEQLIKFLIIYKKNKFLF